MKEFKISVYLLALFFIQIMYQLSFSQQLTVKDYFLKLPKKYITHTGDYGPDECRTLIDVKNGYLTIIQLQGEIEIIVFELALFRTDGQDVLLVASNKIQDPECVSYETFWLNFRNNEWVDAARAVLPAPLLPGSKRVTSCFHFTLPRQGTIIEFHLVECNIEPFDTYTADEKKELSKVRKIKQIRWDTEKGKFMVDKQFFGSQ